MTYAAKYDLRYLAAPVAEQGGLGTCAENALQNSLNVIEKQIGSHYGNISRLQSYYDFREAAHAVDRDSGTNAAVMLMLARDTGLSRESSWSYDLTQYKVKPPASVYEEAAQHKITGYADLGDAVTSNSPTIVNMIKEQLSQGKTPILGFTVKSWFYDEATTNDITKMVLHKENYVANEGVGGHAVFVVGADDSLCNGAGGYIVGSWSPNLAEHGYFVIPYSEFPAAGDNWWNDSTNNFNLISLQVVTGFEGHDQTWSKERINAEQMYVSTLDRGADLKGLDYWAAALKTGAVSSAQMADMILTSSEYLSFHAGFTNSQKINEYYLDTLGRSADAGGLSFWVNAANNGITLGTIFADISNQVYSAASGVDHDFYSNKINLAMTYSVTYQKNDQSNVIHDALLHVTSDANQLEIIKIGMAHDLGIV